MGAGGIQNALDIDSTAEAGSYLDQGRYGYFSLLIQQLNRKQQVSYRLTDLHQVLPLVDPTKDTWISQAEFLLPNRRVVNLARIGLLFVDVDTYRMPWAKGRTPDQQVDSFLYFCEQAGVPQPSLVIWSGRGLHAKWLLDGTLPRQALPRWNACQRFLVDLLHETGADPRAKDASRVLRLVDTVNSRSQQVARVLHITSGTDDKPKRYDFEWLCEMLLPMARWDLEKAGKKRKNRLSLVSDLAGKGQRSFSGRRLAWDRLEDIRTLQKLRMLKGGKEKDGKVKAGERMSLLFWQMNFLLLSGATHSGGLWHEAAELARQMDPNWGYRSSELSTLYRKARAFEAGEKVEFNGRRYPPLYTPKNDTLISLLSIGDDEQKQLKTIISRSESRTRDRLRKEKKRRAAGVVDRATWEASALSQTKPWEALGMSRRTWYRKGKPAVN
ncbi:replication protein [Endozoicomonas lisbonensis]